MVDFSTASTTTPAEGEAFTLADADYCLVEAIKNLTAEIRKLRLNKNG